VYLQYSTRQDIGGGTIVTPAAAIGPTPVVLATLDCPVRQAAAMALRRAFGRPPRAAAAGARAAALKRRNTPCHGGPADARIHPAHPQVSVGPSLDHFRTMFSSFGEVAKLMIQEPVGGGMQVGPVGGGMQVGLVGGGMQVGPVGGGMQVGPVGGGMQVGPVGRGMQVGPVGTLVWRKDQGSACCRLTGRASGRWCGHR
jgi:hypothetical protein